MDELVHIALPRSIAVMSAWVRRAQSGDVRLYLAYFMVGMVLAATISTVVIFFIARLVAPVAETINPPG